MGKQALVKAYACFQTTASPRPFDYENINIRLLPKHNCKWADQILDRHLSVQNITQNTKNSSEKIPLIHTYRRSLMFKDGIRY